MTTVQRVAQVFGIGFLLAYFGFTARGAAPAGTRA